MDLELRMIDTHKTPLNDEDQLEEVVISKTSIKKAMFELQDLADELIKTIPKQIAKLPLSEILLREIELGRKLPSGNSRRRQVQRIAKILRAENLEEIKLALTTQELNHRKNHQSISPAQQWCTRLIDSGRESLAELITLYPDADTQLLGQLVRHAKKETGDEKSTSKKYQQRLFKAIQKTLAC
jgi:ribosome-associated protein